MISLSQDIMLTTKLESWRAYSSQNCKCGIYFKFQIDDNYIANFYSELTKGINHRCILKFGAYATPPIYILCLLPYLNLVVLINFEFTNLKFLFNSEIIKLFTNIKCDAKNDINEIFIKSVERKSY